MIFGFSDPHFFHGHDEGEKPRGVIKHSNRPFAHRNEMNEVIWGNINKVVGEDDLLVCCGDWVHGVGRHDDHYIKYCRDARERINCKNVWLVCGNHDKKWLPEFRGLFQNVFDLLEMQFTQAFCDKWNVHKYLGEFLIWCHYKMMFWKNSRHGSKHVYGHCHGSVEKRMEIRNSFDIGVDCINFTPISLDQMWEKFTSQSHLALADHHYEN